MGTIKPPKMVKSFAGLLVSDLSLTADCISLLELTFGPIDLQSQTIPFAHTDYYHPEMGNQISRLWVSFSELADPENLASWKIRSNQMEETWARECSGTRRRRVNVDPGYLCDSKVVLATTKDYSHRMYLHSGIYAEVTLSYSRGKGWQPYSWTYPDYRDRPALNFFALVRNQYRRQVSGQLRLP
ncbi:MAG: DUF4416 family protein [bacterium]